MSFIYLFFLLKLLKINPFSVHLFRALLIYNLCGIKSLFKTFPFIEIAREVVTFDTIKYYQYHSIDY